MTKKAESVEGFDLSNYEKLASSEGVWMEVMDPKTETPIRNVEGKPVRIMLAGSDSPQYRSKQREYMNRRLKKNKMALGSAEQLDAEKIEMLAACTVGWEGFVMNGKEWAYSTENAHVLYTNPALRFIREQVDDFIGERANFL